MDKKHKFYCLLINFLILGLSACNSSNSNTQPNKFERFDELTRNGEIKNFEELQSALDTLGIENLDEKIYYRNELFKVNFPFNTKLDTVVQIIDNQEITACQLKFIPTSRNKLNEGYLVSYVDINQFEELAPMDEFLTLQRDYLVEISNGKILLEKKEKFLGYACRSLIIKVDDGDLRVTAKLFCKDNYFFKLTVLTKEGNLYNTQTLKFFDSFELN